MSPSSNRWPVIAAYAAVAAANQMLWLTFAPLTTEAARHFGVSEGAVGWLSEVFPLLYVVLALPAGFALDRWFRPTLGGGALLMTLGGFLRLLGGGFAVVLVGQVLVAVAQPFIQNAITKVAAGYLQPRDRAQGIAVGSAGLFVGMVAALVMGTLLSHADQVTALMAVQAVLTAAATAVLLPLLRRPPAPAPAPGATDAPVRGTAPDTAAGLGTLRALWGDPLIRVLAALVFVGFGIFVAETTWLQALLEPAGVTAAQAGTVLVVMVVAGVVGSAALPGPVSARRRQTAFLLTALLVAAAAAVVLAAAPGFAAALGVLAATGLVLLATLPVVLELAESRAGAAGATAAALMWLTGNLGGLAVALVVQVLVHHPVPAFLVVAVVALAGVPLLRSGTLRGAFAAPRAPTDPAPETADREVAG